jgi:S1-C subfamily serine protease
MKRQNDIDILKATGILVSVIILFASLLVYSFNDTSVHYYSSSKTAGGQEQEQGRQDNRIDEDDVAVNNNISELSLPELFSKVEKSVVQVANKEDAGVSLGGRLGSGFVYDKNGHIVTNYHVIAGAATEGNVQITFLDGSTYNARLVGGDPFSDLAVLRLDDENIPEDKLVPLPIGDSTTLRVGEQVVAIGNPFGLSGSMTEGIISGLGRMLPSAEREEESDIIPSDLDSPTGFLIPDIIQTDAPINPGNSADLFLILREKL